MARPIRVAYLPLSPQPGGAERQMLALAERLPRDRFAPELILATADAAHMERAARAGIPVRLARDVGARAEEGGLRAAGARVARLVRALRAGRYDIIDAWLYPMDAAVAIARPLLRGPIVISGRRNLDPHDRFGRVEPVVERLANRLTDTVVANSEAAARHAIETQGVNPDRVRIIRNGVDIPPPASAEARAAARAALGIGPEEVVVGCVASYAPVKRLDRLVDAFAAVASSAPAARLELIGEGPLRADLAGRIEAAGLGGRASLRGFVAKPEAVYPALDVVALTSDREGLPNALLEAAAAGRPIVATAVGGAVEIIEDGQTGFLVDPSDPAALAVALRRLVDDADLRERFGAAGRAAVAERYGMDRFVAEFAALYEERLAVRGASRRRSDEAAAA